MTDPDNTEGAASTSKEAVGTDTKGKVALTPEENVQDSVATEELEGPETQPEPEEQMDATPLMRLRTSSEMEPTSTEELEEPEVESEPEEQMDTISEVEPTSTEELEELEIESEPEEQVDATSSMRLRTGSEVEPILKEEGQKAELGESISTLEEITGEIYTLKNRIQELEQWISEIENTRRIPKGDRMNSKESNETPSEVLETPNSGPEQTDDQEPVLTGPEINIEELIVRARKMEKEQIEEDQQQREINLRHAQYWETKGKELKLEITRVEGVAEEMITRNKEILETLADKLKNEIKNHQEGLDLIGRMLKRLLEQGDRLDKLASDIEATEDLKEFEEQEWKKILEGEINEEAVLKKIEKTLNVIGRENYKRVSKSHEIGENRKKMFLDFMAKQVLPILDGVKDGEKHLKERICRWREQYPEKQSELNEWFQTYHNLESALTALLEKVGVTPMSIEPGIEIDFERHEPFGVEPDPEMENDQIKEIIREGYDYTNPDGNRQFLRVAQVIVVKNDA